LIDFAERRSEATLKRAVLGHGQETAEKIDMLNSQLTWNNDSCIWQWNAVAPRLAVLLTENGATLSRKVLERFGWEMTEPL
jgi:hypothetical protein